MDYDLTQLAKQHGIKRNVILRGIKFTAARMQSLYRIAVKPVDAWQKAVNEQLLPAYAQAMSRLTHDNEADDLAEIIRIAKSLTDGTMVEVSADVRDWMDDSVKWHEKRWADSVKAGTGLDVFPYVNKQTSAARLKAFQERISSLIKDVSDTSRKDIEELIWNGLTNQTPRKELGKQIADRLGIARRRANRIAVDQAQKLNGALTRERMREAGLTKYRWRHSGKLHFRPKHKARNGRIYKIGYPKGDEPGFAIYCFPSGQPVSVHDDVLKIWRRWHSGDLTEFVTASGETVRCTPNHPILTRSGWKPAQAINIGEDIVHSTMRCVDAFDVYIEQREPLIGEVFATGETLFGTVSADAGPGDFHGDVIADENIDVVDTDGGLWAELEACISKSIAEVMLEKADATLLALARSGAFKTSIETVRNATDSRVRSLRLMAALFWRHLVPDNAPRLSSAANWYAIALQHIGDGLALGAEAIAQRFDGLSAKVGPDRFRLIVLYAIARAAAESADTVIAPAAEVLGQAIGMEADERADLFEGLSGFEPGYDKVEAIVTRRWSGHVFNLQTVSGWYVAGKTVVGNCGCVAEPVLEASAEEMAAEETVAEENGILPNKDVSKLVDTLTKDTRLDKVKFREIADDYSILANNYVEPAIRKIKMIGPDGPPESLLTYMRDKIGNDYKTMMSHIAKTASDFGDTDLSVVPELRAWTWRGNSWLLNAQRNDAPAVVKAAAKRTAERLDRSISSWSAGQKIPPRTTFRGVSKYFIEETQLTNAEVGDVVTLREVAATTEDAKFARKWSYDGAIIEYRNNVNRSIADLSKYPFEREVLLQSGTKVRVISKKMKRGVPYVIVEII